MTEYLLSQKKIIALVFFVGLSLFFWLDPVIFFWYDDWEFIYNYLHTDRLAYIFTSHNGHVCPLFNLLYFSELFLFGKNTIFFQIILLILFGIGAYIYYLLFLEVSPKNHVLALILPVLIIAHPNYGQITLWVFQVCIILHMVFQVLCILFYFKYSRTRKPLFFYLFLSVLVLQNYSFGNGIFFPMPFILFEILDNGVKFSKRVILLLVIQAGFLLIQRIFSSQAITLSHLTHDWISITHALYVYLSVSVLRFFFIVKSGGDSMVFIGLLLLGALSICSYRTDRKKTLFGLCYLLVSAIGVPIARTWVGSAISFAYYYSILLFPPLFFLLYIAISDIDTRYIRPVSVFLLFILCFYYIADIKVNKRYTYRHFKNKERLMDAIIYSKQFYYPYNDPYVSGNLSLYWDNVTNPSIMNSIQKNSHFEMDTAIKNYFMSPERVNIFYENSKQILDDYKAMSKRSFVDFDDISEKR